jgi:bifunctional DNA-binding transcriptional regulator/antitoxin component of YhaV-PrlF toxin-antitoxin module
VGKKARTVEAKGRIITPNEWRETHLKRNRNDCFPTKKIKSKFPLKEIDLTKYFDSIKVDLKANLSDWHKVKEELLSR